MPIYEYECTSCHHHFDLIQKINDEPVKICPECSKNSVVKLVSAAGFQLKGSGWYATDFKDKGNSSSVSKDKKKSSAESAIKDTSTKETTTSAESTKTKEANAEAPSKTTTTKGDSE